MKETTVSSVLSTFKEEEEKRERFELAVDLLRSFYNVCVVAEALPKLSE